MAEVNWDILIGSADQANIDRGATGGVPRPNGGGAQLHGFHAITSTPDLVFGRYNNQANFDPTPKGIAEYSAALIRLGGGAAERAIMLFAQLQGTTVAGTCYMLGLAEEEPSRLVLRKGQLSNGLDEFLLDPMGTGVLAVAANAIAEDEYVHVFFGVNVQPQDDVLLVVKQSDLSLNPTDAPDFQPVPGMDSVDPGTGIAFVDDALGLNTGTQPLLDGRVGWAFVSRGLGARAAIDEIQLARQA